MKSISFDIAAVILLVILLGSYFLRKMTKGISNSIVIGITVIYIIAACFDIAAVTLDNRHSTDLSALYTAHAGYLFTHFLGAPLHLAYVISLTDTWHLLKKKKWMQVLLILPFPVMIGLFVMNAGNYLIFSVENGYTRGPWFGFLYMATLYYVAFDIAYLVKYRKLFTFVKMLSISTVIPLSVAAMVVQMLHPKLIIEMFCGAVGLMIVSTGIQRAEDYIDTFTQCMKMSAYVYDMKRTLSIGKHVRTIMINLGNFQSVQAMVGFDAGMEVLRKVADKLQDIDKKMRGHADLYYLDNGRFRIVFTESHFQKVEGIAEAMNAALKEPIDMNGQSVNLMPFVVLAYYPDEFKTFRALMAFGADFHQRNPYTGKVLLASDIFDKTQLNIRNNIDRIIDRALANNSFEVYYQPIYAVSEGRFISAEALLRLNDPEYGFISPEALIVAAEQNGAIHKIGEYVFEKVCQFIASEEFRNLQLDYIEVNLSMAQIMHSDLPEKYLAIMDKYHVTSEQINLEITETAAAYEQEVMMQNLDRLTQAGINFSLDDYGTGYSNMSRMIHLPLKIIKLDKSFVSEENTKKVWIFLKNTVKMLKDMDMEIVVEGVETQEMLDAFSDLQCDFIQGYFFSKPIPQKEFVAFISRANKA